MAIKNVVIPLEVEYLQAAAKERGVSRTKLVRAVMACELEAQLEGWTIDELFALRELVQDVLSKRLEGKKADIERRLLALNLPARVVASAKPNSP